VVARATRSPWGLLGRGIPHTLDPLHRYRGVAFSTGCPWGFLRFAWSRTHDSCSLVLIVEKIFIFFTG
jgi:hypothetical protein